MQSPLPCSLIHESMTPLSSAEVVYRCSLAFRFEVRHLWRSGSCQRYSLYRPTLTATSSAHSRRRRRLNSLNAARCRTKANIFIVRSPLSLSPSSPFLPSFAIAAAADNQLSILSVGLSISVGRGSCMKRRDLDCMFRIDAGTRVSLGEP